MSVQTVTLADFLLARIAEDEQVARDADNRIYPSTWQETRDRVKSGWHVAHIARHNPARVLAECNAKRRIVEAEIGQMLGSPSGYVDREVYERIRARADSDILRALALPYADHRDYRDEWKP